MLSLLKTVLKSASQKPVKTAPNIQPPIAEPSDSILETSLSEFADLWQAAEKAGQSGNREEARSLLYQALELQPSNSELLYQLGATERKMEIYEDAYDNLLLAIHHNPNHVPSYQQLFILCCKQNSFTEAEIYINKAIEIAPEKADLYCDIGNMRIEQERYEEAISLINQAIDLSPDWGVAYNNLGNCYLRMKEYDQAKELLLIAKALRANVAEVYINLNYLYYSFGDMAKAYRYAKKGLAIYPDNEQLNWMHCWILLLYKRFEQGWNIYDVRFTSVGGVVKRDLPFPVWQGQYLGNKKIVVVTEQGLGDQLMFSSCLPDLLNQAESCIVECDAKLTNLFARSFPSIEFLGMQRRSDAEFLATLPSDVHCYTYLGDLPRWFRRDVSSFFPAKAYMKADTTKTDYWRQCLDKLGDGLKVGISWRGGVEKTRTHFRTIPLTEWSAIFRTPGVHFINLQYGDCEQDICDANERNGITIHHWEQAIVDYDETAALVSALDLVISVCTSVIHLTGALGKQAWVLVPCSPEWRYLARDETLPWYQNIKLFRQTQLGDWEPLIESVGTKLAALAGQTHQK